MMVIKFIVVLLHIEEFLIQRLLMAHVLKMLMSYCKYFVVDNISNDVNKKNFIMALQL